MNAQTIPYLFVYVSAFLIGLVVFVYSWRNRTAPGVRAFAVGVALEISWLAGYIFEINSPLLDEKIFWDNFQYIGTFYAPIALFIFALGFTDRKINTRRWVIALGVLPTFTLISIFANFWPELIRVNVHILSGVPYDELTYEYGTIASIGNYFLYVLSLAYILILIAGFRRKEKNFRTQLWLVLLGTGIPILALILAQIFGIKFANQRDVSPLFFVISNAVIGFGIFRFRIFNIVPVARDALFENIEDVLIILDTEDVVVDVNPPARSLIKASGQKPTGIHIKTVFPELYEQFQNIAEMRTEITGADNTFYSLKITPLYDRSGHYLGRLVNAHNITFQKNTEKELKETIQENMDRAELFQNVAEISRIITSIQDTTTLLSELPKVISRQFDMYHVGIFLLDDQKETAILQAANSEGGKRMLARKHRLKVGSESMVGYATAQGEARVSRNVTETDAFYYNPELPETRSELTVPLKIVGEVIGALDIQSKQVDAFDDLEIRVGMLLADLIAIAIQNTRLNEENITALKNAEKAYRQVSGAAWKETFKIQTIKGYEYDGIRSQPLSETSNEEHSLVIPVQVHGEKIGAIKLDPLEPGREWTDDEVAILSAAAERSALALENARLLEEAQRRAAKERTISESTTKVSSALDVESILQTTAEELERVLGGSEIIIQLENK